MSQPPPPDAPVVFAIQQGQQYGPMPLQQVIDAVREGRAPADTPVWWEGAADWQPFNRVPGLAASVIPPGQPAPQPATQPAAQPPDQSAGQWSQPAAYAAPAATPEEVEELEALFTRQVEQSWAYYKRVDYATRLDEVLIGALITATLDTGMVLIDLTSTGTNHFLRFEHPADRSRTTIGLEHLTPSAVQGEVLGHHASVLIGWGQRVANAQEVVRAVKEELKSNLAQTPEPGTVTVDGDITSGYAYTQIDLIWALEDFVDRNYHVDTELLTRHVAAAVHSLRKFWYGRFTPATS